ncbi:hypothetical protein BAX97_05415 [Elizabethkingia meningoseptica]|uniref:DUF4286 family protein n=1 Tax=Elizabethkingia meningoseptica TaxID=238 RepID=UPI000332C522|nr:DUF4286 family protein [Elizabethkingia meningoseptica]AQX05717.1 hypothetical protein BBD33_10865 [Elizabethkingia meningoseptica]AQX47760.1 hypothetical protein B5G46_10855 [Elizabethkingia meningoseptica]EOR29193.1 hypothetical protein L100_12328 [Elizabethkingia meningoseptica ATCC 13253 = NBRC 12535]KUY23976.1 hypothetical protein ATB99_00255 [Elizabethkingia meningoseptica]MDE5489857.1 DUF4286 family protein [Elizabethkingia meningoseptica]
MSVLSVTFHVESKVQPQWYDFLEKEFPGLIENLYDLEKYIFSEVSSSYIDEGKNYNLLMIFGDHEIRAGFLLNEMQNLSEIIHGKFSQEEVMIFITELNPITKRL